MMNHCNVAIVGAGATGDALAYHLAEFTDVGSVVVLDKDDGVALEASDPHGNSQSNHNGEVESNYTRAKAAEVKFKADLNERYGRHYGLMGRDMLVGQRMLLAVGEQEVEFVDRRYEDFLGLYPHLQRWTAEDLRRIEPRVMAGRREPVLAMGSQGKCTTINFGAMARSMIANALQAQDKTVELELNTRVREIRELAAGGFELVTNKGVLGADVVLVNAGAYSLWMAHQNGHGLEYSCLPISGGFYMANSVIVNGKVYMVQNPKLPFAALHMDPDLLVGGTTRIGPTAFPMPWLEFNNGLSTSWNALESLNLDRAVIQVLWNMLKDSDIRNYQMRNGLYGLPLIGHALFLQDARKIVPDLGWNEIHKAKGYGGVRPQVINKKTGELVFGEVAINTGRGLIYNMTPSPGATSALANGRRDAKMIAEFLGRRYHEDRFQALFGEPS